MNTLTDTHGRQMTYLRLAVTDRCNLRCRYCMPAEGIAFAPREELLTFEEILRLGEVLAELGVTKVRLTGGEPLARRNLLALVTGLSELFPQLAMTTNGVLLPDHLDGLAAAGLTHYNLSLDTLRPDRFRAITRRDDFAATRRALDLLLEREMRVKINTVVLRGTNDDELIDFAELTREHPLDVRFIEAMPFNEGDGNQQLFLDAATIIGRLRTAYPGLVAATDDPHASTLRYRVPGYAGGIGVIPAYSRSLCGSCNRLRLTPKGTLLNCLYSTRGLELRPLLRSGVSGQDLAQLILEFVKGKHRDGHDTERREQQGSVFSSMTSIGG